MTTKQAPGLLLAHSWSPDIDPKGYWMSEKLDGVRALWDGKEFITRLGGVYEAPHWFKERLPSYCVDGELWCGRKQFQKTVSIVRKKLTAENSESWREVKFVAFDLPEYGKIRPFEDRLETLYRIASIAGFAQFAYHEHVRCHGIDHLREELEQVEKAGGEGLMLRQPGSYYASTRSKTLLKVKSFRDAEATVVGHVQGKGRHSSRLGALTVRTEDGKEFNIGTGFTDVERESPPPIGSLVTYRYQELSTFGIPRFPVFVRVRTDL